MCKGATGHTKEAWELWGEKRNVIKSCEYVFLRQGKLVTSQAFIGSGFGVPTKFHFGYSLFEADLGGYRLCKLSRQQIGATVNITKCNVDQCNKMGWDKWTVYPLTDVRAGAFVRGPWSGCCTQFKAGNGDQLDTKTEAVPSRPSDDSRRFAPLCQFEVSWRLLCPLSSGQCESWVFLFLKGAHCFYVCPFEPTPSSYPQDNVVSGLKREVKPSAHTRMTEHHFWSQGSWIDFFFFLSLPFLLPFIGGNLGQVS